MRLTPQVSRYLLLGPTLGLSVVLGNHGYPPLPRLAACVGLAAVILTGLTLLRRRQANERGLIEPSLGGQLR